MMGTVPGDPYGKLSVQTLRSQGGILGSAWMLAPHDQDVQEILKLIFDTMARSMIWSI